MCLQRQQIILNVNTQKHNIIDIGNRYSEKNNKSLVINILNVFLMTVTLKLKILNNLSFAADITRTYRVTRERVNANINTPGK